MPKNQKEEQVVTPSDILRIGKKWFYKDRELTDKEVDNLKSEASVIANTALWKIIVNEGKYHAQKRAVMDVKSYEELSRVQEFHKVVVLFEQFINKIISSR